MLGELDPLGVNGGDRAVAAQTHAQYLGQAVHRVGGIHTRAGATGRAGILFPLMQLFFIDLTGVERALCFKHRGKRGLMTIHMTGQHRAAGDENGRDIQSGRGHQQAGNVFIAVGDHNKAVELMSQRHRLGRVGDQVAGDQRILHTDMSHRDAVTHRDCGDDDRGAARHRDAHLDRLRDLIEVHMTGDDLVPAGNNADQRALHLFSCISECVKQRTGRSRIRAFFYMVASHNACSFLPSNNRIACMM